jgi:hypothetical protein
MRLSSWWEIIAKNMTIRYSHRLTGHCQEIEKAFTPLSRTTNPVRTEERKIILSKKTAQLLVKSKDRSVKRHEVTDDV